MSLSGADGGRTTLVQAIGALRPKLHRYTARMTGSAIDGEDVVQDGLLKAIEALPRAGAIVNVEGWVFRIIHNTALDYLRRRGRQGALQADGDPDDVADPGSLDVAPDIAATSLRTFMHLPPAQRSSVILMDVLGHSLQEIAEATGLTVLAVKAALHKGRVRLRALAQVPEGPPPPRLDMRERDRLAAYVARFNAREFDLLRDLLADDVRLDLLGKNRLEGRDLVGRYFGNYGQIADWHLGVGHVDGRLAILVVDPRQVDGAPLYFILLDWEGDHIRHIRDFRYARYVMTEVALARD
ncbi:RNA polymerase sigma factor [Bradyrhizobium sp. 2TAF24]|uniref:RNA polymerase sigma factor n=1 Tax=Bradyrhizobium sp. 2TAF24 TaxID=3233011 RepID=UPI003F8DA98F